MFSNIFLTSSFASRFPGDNYLLRTRCIPFEWIFTTACLVDEALKTYILRGPSGTPHETHRNKNERGKNLVGVCGERFFQIHFFSKIFFWGHNVWATLCGNKVERGTEREEPNVYTQLLVGGVGKPANTFFFSSRRNVRFHILFAFPFFRHFATNTATKRSLTGKKFSHRRGLPFSPSSKAVWCEARRGKQAARCGNGRDIFFAVSDEKHSAAWFWCLCLWFLLVLRAFRGLFDVSIKNYCAFRPTACIPAKANSQSIANYEWYVEIIINSTRNMLA